MSMILEILVLGSGFGVLWVFHSSVGLRAGWAFFRLVRTEKTNCALAFFWVPALLASSRSSLSLLSMVGKLDRVEGREKKETKKKEEGGREKVSS